MSRPYSDNDSSSPSLDALQRWFQATVTHPGGVAAGAQSEAAVAAFANGAVDEIACDSPRQTAEQRLAVYAHAYWARLLECLREEFPVLRITVGEEAFDGLAVGYLMAHPSTSYTLGRLSERFAAYLQSTTAGDEADAFSALVIDLARLEQSVNDVFDAPGGETLGFLTTEQLDQVLLEQRGALRLLLLPTVRLLSFRTNANEVFTATRAGAATLPMPELRPTFAALTRRDYVVRRLSLTPTQFELLTAIASGQSLNDALGALCDRQASVKTSSLSDIEPIDADALQTWFAEWAQVGIFASLEL